MAKIEKLNSAPGEGVHEPEESATLCLVKTDKYVGIDTRHRDKGADSKHD